MREIIKVFDTCRKKSEGLKNTYEEITLQQDVVSGIFLFVYVWTIFRGVSL